MHDFVYLYILNKLLELLVFPGVCRSFCIFPSSQNPIAPYGPMLIQWGGGGGDFAFYIKNQLKRAHQLNISYYSSHIHCCHQMQHK